MTLPGFRKSTLRRAIGVLAVLVLHLAVVALLIQSTRTHLIFAGSTREIILRLVTPKPALQPSHPRIAPEAKARHASKPPAIPNYSRFTLPSAWHGTALRALPSLMDCAPQNRGDLTLAQLAQCNAPAMGMTHDNGAADYADHTDRSKDAALWERRRARKNSPLLLPCMSPNGIGVSLATLACLVKRRSTASSISTTNRVTGIHRSRTQTPKSHARPDDCSIRNLPV